MRAAPLALAWCLACGGSPPAVPGLDEATLWGQVAARAVALTFARRTREAGGELLRVRSVARDQVEAVIVPDAGDPFGFGNLWRGGAYLQPEDVVISRASGLGVLRSRIGAEAR